jgi:polar amino acid transport system permease protein
MLVQALIMAYGVPWLLQSWGIDFTWPQMVIPAIIVCGCNSAAYMSEVIRSGIQAIDKGQMEAARSLGMSHGMAMRLVIIPQALRKIAPALMNDFIAMQKDVGLISTLGAVDAVRAAQIVVAKTYNFTPYIVASIVFILMSVPFILLNDWYSERLRKREQTGGMV